MPNNLIKKKGVIFGAGEMAVEYSKVLEDLAATFTIVGRSETGVRNFFEKTGIQALPNGFATWEKLNLIDTEYAIIAVNIEALAETAVKLMDFGIRNILLEKPGVSSSEELEEMLKWDKSIKEKIIQ